MKAFFAFSITTIIALQLVTYAQKHSASENTPPVRIEAGKYKPKWENAGSGGESSGVPKRSPRRLESCTWNPVNHQLIWDVSKGVMKDKSYKPVATDRYRIDLENATMTYNGNTRKFSEDEAADVQGLMRVLSQYAVESTVWWENGQGEPLDGGIPRDGSSPENPDKKPDTKDKKPIVRTPLNQIAEMLVLFGRQ